MKKSKANKASTKKQTSKEPVIIKQTQKKMKNGELESGTVIGIGKIKGDEKLTGFPNPFLKYLNKDDQ